TGVSGAPKLPISPLAGVEERSAQRVESQLLGFPSDEDPAGQRGRCPANVHKVLQGGGQQKTHLAGGSRFQSINWRDSAPYRK
ncbi:hypothetical protein EN991_23355, partial [Mesorhizobium sp. M7A.F.Ca.US.005.03.2.1]|uniref:hypothetical protein n=1 Tax=Mesorhizobium sp. M7A.F.Ca.US.005.03.2.1 TaxID=2496737 RepID=UPI000FD52413